MTARTTLILMATLLNGAGAAQAGSLSVEIGTGIKAGEQLMVAVYDHDSTWLKKSVRGVREAAPENIDRRGWHTLTVDALPPGRYALAVYVDRNGNGKLDRGMFGIPSEPYGFSNGGGSFGPPDFGAAAFDIGPNATTIRVELN